MLAVFDFDGVLLDSKPCMQASWKAVQDKYGLSIPFEAYFAMIGHPLLDILDTLGIKSSRKEMAETYYQASRDNADLNKLYPGTLEGLSRLKENDHTICIVTSKGSINAKFMLDKFGLAEFISLLVCPDLEFELPLRGKPSADPLLYTMLKTGHSTLDSFYVGDMFSDYQCALKAGVPYFHASWGYGSPPPGHSYTVATHIREVGYFL